MSSLMKLLESGSKSNSGQDRDMSKDFRAQGTTVSSGDTRRTMRHKRLLATLALAVSLVGFNLPICSGQSALDSKGLKRDIAITQPAEPSDPLRGKVSTDRFPNPDEEEIVQHTEDSPSGSQTASERLKAIITKTQTSPWERYYKQGNDSFFQGYYEDAEKHYLQAIRELKKTNQKDERLLKTRNSLGQAFLKDGKYLDAREAFELALKSAEDLGQGKEIEKQQSEPRRGSRGERSVYTAERARNEASGANIIRSEMAKALSGLASVYKANQQYKKSEQFYKESVKIRHEVQGAQSPQIAQTLLDLGELYREQKLFSEAEPVYGLALETLNNCKDVPELTKAYFLDKAGMCFHDQGKIVDARKLFEISLMMKDKYSRLYSPTNARKTGLVYYKCLNGIPNATRVFTRGIEIEALHVKDLTAVATLTAQVYGPDWYLLKAEVTVHNQGKTAVTALADAPTLALEAPRRKLYTPLDSNAIAQELGMRGRILYNRLLHSADFDYVLNNLTVGGASTVAMTPAGPAIFNTVGSWATITPNWEARMQARNAAIAALASANAEGATVRGLKPGQTTIGPGETATFLVFFPYNKFDACTLRMLFGNAVLEFPFTSQSG